MDDIFCVIDDVNEIELQQLLIFINSLDQHLNFTLEIESNKELNFLDLTVFRNCDHLSFKIYRKPTHTDHCIDYMSNHPDQYKVAFFNSMFHRLFSVPLEFKYFELELRTILQIANANHFSIETIRSIFYKKRNRILNLTPHHTQERESKKFFSFPYFNSFSLKFKHMFMKQGINLAFRNNLNLKYLLVKNKDVIPTKLKNGVYKLVCNCGAVYIGQTGRAFVTRVKEHISCARLGKDNSNFALHLNSENHDYDPETFFRVLHIYNKGLKLNIAENLEIIESLKKDGDKNLNDQIKFVGYEFFKSLPL